MEDKALIEQQSLTERSVDLICKILETPLFCHFHLSNDSQKAAFLSLTTGTLSALSGAVCIYSFCTGNDSLSSTVVPITFGLDAAFFTSFYFVAGAKANEAEVNLEKSLERLINRRKHISSK